MDTHLAPESVPRLMSSCASGYGPAAPTHCQNNRMDILDCRCPTHPCPSRPAQRWSCPCSAPAGQPTGATHSPGVRREGGSKYNIRDGGARQSVIQGWNSWLSGLQHSIAWHRPWSTTTADLRAFRVRDKMRCPFRTHPSSKQRRRGSPGGRKE